MAPNVAIKQESKDDVSSSSDSRGINGNGPSNYSNGSLGACEDGDKLEDDDDYEDSLDLDTSKADTKVWLVRVPKFLMEKWQDHEKLHGQNLGKVRIRTNTSNPSEQKWDVKLMLNDTPETQSIPREYDILLAKQRVNNTFVFTEKDLPKYDKKKAQEAAAAAANRQQQKKAGKFQFNKDRFVPYVKTIPKRTSLVGKVYHECNVIPSLTDPNYSRVISERRKLQEDEPRPKVTLLNESPGVTSGSFSQTLRGQSSQFMRAQKKDNKLSSEGKATRIPRNELLDLLFKLFEEYDYWSLKGLKERTKQPEVYLKEVLDDISTLIKKGVYSMKYCLKPEYKNRRAGDGLADIGEGGSGDGNLEDASAGGNPPNEDDDDDDIEMETVV